MVGGEVTPQPLPPVDLDEIERLLSEATAGPWIRLHDDGRIGIAVEADVPGQGHMTLALSPHGNRCECGQVWSEAVDWPVAFCDTREGLEGPTGKVRMANAALIVALVNSAPGLIARIRQLEGALRHHYQQDIPFYERQLLARKALGVPE